MRETIDIEAKRECERLVYPCPRMYASPREAKYFNWESLTKQLMRVGGTRLVNVQPCGRWSALHQAVYGDSVEMVSLLLDCLANVNALAGDGKTPLGRKHTVTVATSMTMAGGVS